MKRTHRKQVAEATVAMVSRGQYDLPDGNRVEFGPLVEACLSQTVLFTPEDLERKRKEVQARAISSTLATIEVRNETTLCGAARLLERSPRASVAALNFASAKNPGGGFLNGSQAQEESIARSSALYASLLRAPEYYQRHRSSSSCLYSDAMILSPDCPVFRDDDDNLLERPFPVTFITSAAPNAGAIKEKERSLLPMTLRNRAELVLALAAFQGCDSIVLGAWGCGVFRNDPEMVATIFAEQLRGANQWITRFSRIVFSVFDTSDSQATFECFDRVLGDAT